MSAKVVQLFAPGDPKKPKAAKSVDPYAHVTTSPHFEKAWSAFPATGRLRSSKKQAFAEWKKVAPIVGKDALVCAVERYAREDKDAKRDSGPPGFHRWLNWGRWEHWLPKPEEAAKPSSRRFPDEALRAKVVSKLGEAWTISWLDGCACDAGVIVCPTGKVMNLGKLSEERARLRALGIEYRAG